jgi:hypothetical protein
MAGSQEICFMIRNAGLEAVSCRFKLAAGCNTEASADAAGAVADTNKVRGPMHLPQASILPRHAMLQCTLATLICMP